MVCVPRCNQTIKSGRRSFSVFAHDSALFGHQAGNCYHGNGRLSLSLGGLSDLECWHPGVWGVLWWENEAKVNIRNDA